MIRALALAAVLTFVLSGVAAVAKPPDDQGNYVKVRKLKPWRPNYVYLVERSFELRREPSPLAARSGARVTKGGWHPISCQGYANSPKGRVLWVGLGGVYAPDAIYKTYSDGKLEGVPTCSFPDTGRVFGPQRWTAKSRYRVNSTQILQRRPRPNNGTGRIINLGSWVRISCQIKGAAVKGSRLWNRIGSLGGYLPDQEMKTFTDGRIQGAPACKGPRQPKKPVYMALGDSYASGLGNEIAWAGNPDRYYAQPGQYYTSGPVGGPSSKDCYRGLGGWPRFLAGRFRQRWDTNPRTTFLACQGDTTAEVLSRQVPHIKRRTRFVTLSVMGNDMGFSSVVKACVTPTKDCYGEIENQFGKRNATLRSRIRRLDSVLRAIRRKAPRATIAVLGYPPLFEPEQTSVKWCFDLAVNEARALKRKGIALNRAIKNATKRHRRVTFVSIARQFAGHGPCQPASFNVFINPILDDKNDGGRFPEPVLQSMHPNRQGQLLYAEIVAKRFPKLFR